MTGVAANCVHTLCVVTARKFRALVYILKRVKHISDLDDVLTYFYWSNEYHKHTKWEGTKRNRYMKDTCIHICLRMLSFIELHRSLICFFLFLHKKEQKTGKWHSGWYMLYTCICKPSNEKSMNLYFLRKIKKRYNERTRNGEKSCVFIIFIIFADQLISRLMQLTFLTHTFV